MFISLFRCIFAAPKYEGKMLAINKENITLLFKQHKDIFIFVMVIVRFHAFWKIGREADASGQIIHFYGLNFSPFFTFISEVWTSLVYRFVYLFKGDVLEMHFCSLHYPDTNTGMRIVWGCSGIKEVMMTSLVIITARGDYRKKWWYIPLGVLFVLLLNFIRLVSILFLVHHHNAMFDFVHGIVFRAFMYGGIFLVWLIWTERINHEKLKVKS
ncbi:MAG: hypothetical protein PF444_02585 [Bacteroidales bacterium]|nr:hypothetical protein [Bacteroidales bacterium]